LKVASGDYDILMVDCSGNTILQDNGVSITKSGTYTVRDQTPTPS